MESAEYVPYSKLGCFELIALLRTGTFDAVYTARDTERHRLVALKLPMMRSHPPSMDVKPFFDGSVQLTYLHHPSIIRVDRVGEEKGVPYLTSEFTPETTISNS